MIYDRTCCWNGLCIFNMVIIFEEPGIPQLPVRFCIMIMRLFLLSFSHSYIQKITYVLFHARNGFGNQNSVVKKQTKSFVLSTVRFSKEYLL